LHLFDVNDMLFINWFTLTDECFQLCDLSKDSI